MSLVSLFVLLLVAAICGSLGSAIAGYTSRGCLVNIVLGLAGAIIGTWLSQVVHIRDFLYFKEIPIIWSIIGAAIFVAIVNALCRPNCNKKN